MIVKYNNDREVAIVQIVAGSNPLRERGSNGLKIVRVANNSEYEIMIKNQLSDRMLASVSIDGSPLGDSLVVKGHGALHLERFLDTSKRFKFVRYEGSGQENSVQKRDAGIIKVRIQYNIPLIPAYLKYIEWPDYYSADDAPQAFYSTAASNSMTKGVTVEGSESDQKFVNIEVSEHFAHEDTIRFQLVEADQPRINTSDCSLDHYTLRQLNHSFCNQCGSRL